LDAKKTILLGIALVIGAIAGYRIVHTLRYADAESEDFPEGTFWVCLSPECGHEFVKSIDDLIAFYGEHPGEPMPCPACGGTDTTRAIRCSNCQRFFPREAIRGQEWPMCPRCGKKLPPLAPAGEAP
jgi:DNA-directed RNA polymerase subunit RPC12/RpoP